jgi:hypothetical protein
MLGARRAYTLRSPTLTNIHSVLSVVLYTTVINVQDYRADAHPCKGVGLSR